MNYYWQAPWIPQQDLLASGHVRLFVSQLGMVSLQEAVYHGVPILGMPLTYEQGLNSDIVTMKNIGGITYMTLPLLLSSSKLKKFTCRKSFENVRPDSRDPLGQYLRDVEQR